MKTTEELESGLDRAFQRFLAGYRRWGGYRFHGWTNQSDHRNYRGPAVWSEADCVLRLARELETEFPDQVHAEFKIATWTRADFNPAEDKVQSVDLAVTDFSNFTEYVASQQRFRRWKHVVFIVAKGLGNGGWGGTWEMDARGQIPSIEADAQRLARHLELGRCRVAAVLVVDDECFFESHSDVIEWPATVKRLLASPAELKRRGANDQAIDTELERIAALLEREAKADAARRAESEMLSELAEGLLEDLEELDRCLPKLKVREFEAVTARAIADKNVTALVMLRSFAATKDGRRWVARRRLIEDVLGAVG